MKIYGRMILVMVLALCALGTGQVTAHADGVPVITTTDKIVVIGKDNDFLVEATGGTGTLSFSASGLPSGAKFDPATHKFTWSNPR